MATRRTALRAATVWIIAVLAAAACTATPPPPAVGTSATGATPRTTAATTVTAPTTSAPTAARPTQTRTQGRATHTTTPTRTAPTSTAPTASTTHPPATVPRPSPTRRPTATHPTGAAGTGYSINTNPDGTTTRWNPCSPIRWALNPAHAPSGAVADITTALARISAATGLRFTRAPNVHTVPTSATLDRGPADLTIAWVTPGTSDLLDNHTESARGGWKSTPTLDSRTGVISWRITAGYVLLDTGDQATWKPGFGTGRRRGTLLLHELGHAVGLNHTTTPGQVMNAQITTASTSTFGTGDKTGLRLVGKTGGCLP